MRAGKNSSALAGPPVACFNNVNIFRQHRTMHSNFSCGAGNESIAIKSVEVKMQMSKPHRKSIMQLRTAN